MCRKIIAHDIYFCKGMLGINLVTLLVSKLDSVQYVHLSCNSENKERTFILAQVLSSIFSISTYDKEFTDQVLRVKLERYVSSAYGSGLLALVIIP